MKSLTLLGCNIPEELMETNWPHRTSSWEMLVVVNDVEYEFQYFSCYSRHPIPGKNDCIKTVVSEASMLGSATHMKSH